MALTTGTRLGPCEIVAAKHARHSAWQVATVCGARHDADKAFEWLERSYAQHDSGLALLFPSPHFTWLRQDPRWRPFLENIGLAKYERR